MTTKIFETGQLTAEQLIAFAEAVDVPLIYIMKLDACKCFKYKSVFYYVLNQEFLRSRDKEGMKAREAYAEIRHHFGCSTVTIIAARKMCGTYYKKK